MKFLICLLFHCSVVLASSPPERIVVLMPHIAETLYEFGLDREIVGVPEFTKVPSDKQTPKIIGPYHRIPIENVIALKPTIVLASIDGNEPLLVKKLREMSIQVKVFDPRTMEGVFETLDSLSGVAKRLKPALAKKNDDRILAMHKKLEKSKSVLSGSRVFIQIGFDPLVTVSKKSFLGELLEYMGAENLYAESELSYPRPSLEDVVSKKPDTVLIVNLTDSLNESKKAVAVWKKFRSLPATEKNRILVISGNKIVKPGLGLGDGLESLVPLLRGNHVSVR